MSQIQIKLAAISHLVCTQNELCRCEYRNDYSAAFSVFGHDKAALNQMNIPLSPSLYIPCRVGSVGSVSASRTVGREFASRPGHTKDHHKNGTNCLPA